MPNLQVVRESHYEAPVWRHRDMRGTAALLMLLVLLLMFLIGMALIDRYTPLPEVEPWIYIGVAAFLAALGARFYLAMCEMLDPSSPH